MLEDKEKREQLFFTITTEQDGSFGIIINDFMVVDESSEEEESES